MVSALASTYEIGTVNKYSYETTVVVNEKCGTEGDNKQVGHQLKAEIHLTNIWENLQKKLIKIEASISKQRITVCVVLPS